MKWTSLVNKSSEQVTKKDQYRQEILDFCKDPKSFKEIQEYIGIKSRSYLLKSILKEMIEEDTIVYTQKAKTAPNQKYITNERKRKCKVHK